MKKNFLVYASFGGMVFVTSILGAHATRSGLLDWYPALSKPLFQPPPQVFPIVWTILYVAIAVAGAMIYLSAQSRARSIALTAWFAQLGFNAAWSELFFRHRRPDLALIDIVALLLSILVFGLAAKKVDERAFRLFVPYLFWVAFAALLNEEIVSLKPRFVSAPSEMIEHSSGYQKKMPG